LSGLQSSFSNTDPFHRNRMSKNYQNYLSFVNISSTFCLWGLNRIYYWTDLYLSTAETFISVFRNYFNTQNDTPQGQQYSGEKLVQTNLYQRRPEISTSQHFHPDFLFTLTFYIQLYRSLRLIQQKQEFHGVSFQYSH